MSALAALLAAAALPGLAHAKPATISGAKATALSLAGERVVFSQASDDRGARVYAQEPGDKRFRIATLDPLRTKRFGRLDLGYSLAASDNRFAVLREDSHEFVARNERDPRLDFFRRTTTSAPLGGKQNLRRACSPPIGARIDGNGLRPAKLKLDGDGLASFGLDCEGKTLIVRNLSSGSKRAFELASNSFEQFDIAGRFIVYRERSSDARARLRVADWPTGTEIYRLDLTNLLAGASVGELLQEPTVQADGKVAIRLDRFQADDPCQALIVWFSPQEPFAHVVDPGACVPGEASFSEKFDSYLRFAGDRLAFVVKVGGDRQLVTTNLGGGDVRRFARFATPKQLTGFDYDGQRMAWAESECRRIQVSRAAGEASPLAPPSCN